MTNKKKYVVFALIFVTIATVLIIRATHEPKCKSQDYFNALKFHAVVTTKRLDPEQHSIPVIVLIDLNSKVEMTIDFFKEKSNSYKNINVNDTLYKSIHSDSLYVVKNNVKIFFEKVEFECSN